MTSKVAEVLQAIQVEYEAGRRALTNSAVARHAFIHARMRRMQQGYQALHRLTSPERALEMVMHHVGGRDGASTVSHYDTPVA